MAGSCLLAEEGTPAAGASVSDSAVQEKKARNDESGLESTALPVPLPEGQVGDDPLVESVHIPDVSIDAVAAQEERLSVTADGGMDDRCSRPLSGSQGTWFGFASSQSDEPMESFLPAGWDGQYLRQLEISREEDTLNRIAESRSSRHPRLPCFAYQETILEEQSGVVEETFRLAATLNLLDPAALDFDLIHDHLVRIVEAMPEVLEAPAVEEDPN